MPQNEYSDYRLIFKSTPNAINFNEQSLRSFPTIYMMSDIFGFYPYGELYFGDSAGAIVDNIMFVEGLKFEFKIGNDDEGYVGHDFYWSEDQINNTTIAENITGTNIFILKSYYDYLDVTRTKAWSSSTLSAAITDIAGNDFGITDANKLHIFGTTGSDTWYQINSKVKDFIWDHREQAYTANYPNSPFISFINTNGEFYFTCLEHLFNEQQPVAKYKFSFSEKSVIDSDTVKDYSLAFVGAPISEFNYKKKLYNIGKTGAYASADSEIQNFLATNRKGKALFRRELQDNYADYEYLGINESIEDEYRLNAKRNFEYIDSALPIRMNLTISFNPKCVSGKLIDLQVGSAMDDKQVLSDLSGNWLIISDKQFMDFDGVPYTNLIIAKSKVNIDNSNPFSSDFLS